MILFSLKLLLAHILGDFVLQPSSWVAKKSKKKHRLKYLLLHGAVHAILLLLVFEFQLKYLGVIALIVVVHLLIDWVKLAFQHLQPTVFFIGDQMLHLLVLAAFVHYYFPVQWEINPTTTTKLLLFAVAVLSVTFIGAILIKLLTQKWKINETDKKESLKDAGKYIGMLERLFVFGFIALHFWPGIGFLLAAKSIFRFGDLTNAKDRKLTEYILIGTLLSFGFAVCVGLVFNWVLPLIS